jgi:hypothetical protein
LELVHLATELAAFYSLDGRYASEISAVLDEMERRGAAREKHYGATYRTLVQLRDFDRARDLALKHPIPELEVLPEIREPIHSSGNGPRVWCVSEGRNELVQQHVDITQGVQIIVVSHPLCHFSRAAFSALESDSVLAPLFRAHARWIGPQNGALNVPVLQQWNRQHRKYPIELVVKQDEWPFDYWGLPTFYFLQGGAVTVKIVGWEGRRQELLAACRKTGLLK